MYNIFLKESADEQVVSLYNELTDSVTGRHRYEHEIEDGIKPIGSAYVKVLTPTEQTIACTFGNKENEVNVFNIIDMYRKRCLCNIAKNMKDYKKGSKML